MTLEDRHALRQERAPALLEQLQALLLKMKASRAYLKKSIAGQAIDYTLKRWEKLTRFMEHSVIELSTNWAENSMRPISIGRRNWLQIGSKEAGPKIAAIFSIIESCRKLGVPIRQYMADVLPGLADRSIQALAGLTPAATPPKWQSSLPPGLPGPVNHGVRRSNTSFNWQTAFGGPFGDERAVEECKRVLVIAVGVAGVPGAMSA